MNKISRFIIIVLLIFALLLSIVEIILNIQEKELSSSTQAIWDVMFFVSTIFWAYYDADRKDLGVVLLLRQKINSLEVVIKRIAFKNAIIQALNLAYV